MSKTSYAESGVDIEAGTRTVDFRDGLIVSDVATAPRAMAAVR